jgi:hypothetical protein
MKLNISPSNNADYTPLDLLLAAKSATRSDVSHVVDVRGPARVTGHIDPLSERPKTYDEFVRSQWGRMSLLCASSSCRIASNSGSFT